MKKIFLFSLFFIIYNPIHSQKIVSLAPGLTEIVFSLGKGNLIIGDTKFCDYPEEAKYITHVGGLLDLNIERIISLKPDLILLYPELYSRLKFLENRIKLLILPHIFLDDLYISIIRISKEIGIEKKGDELVLKIKNEISQVKNEIRKKKKCLFIIDRNLSDLKNIYILGKKDFLNEILSICGGENVYKGDILYPLISIESIIILNPEIIFDISFPIYPHYQKEVREMWNYYKIISAVKNKKVFLVSNSAWLRLGPRLGMVAQEMSYLINNDQDQ